MRSTVRTALDWRFATALAIAFSLAHFIMDWHIGLFGRSSDDISPLQAALVWLTALLFAWWAFTLASAANGGRSGLVLLALFSAGWALLGNGLPIFACLPPCQGAFPHQDIAHVGSLLFGGWAAYAVTRAARATPGSIRWLPLGAAGALLMAIFAVEAALSM